MPLAPGLRARSPDAQPANASCTGPDPGIWMLRAADEGQRVLGEVTLAGQYAIDLAVADPANDAALLTRLTERERITLLPPICMRGLADVAGELRALVILAG